MCTTAACHPTPAQRTLPIPCGHLRWQPRFGHVVDVVGAQHALAPEALQLVAHLLPINLATLLSSDTLILYR